MTRALALALSVTFFAVTSSFGATYVVHADQQGDFATIQEAIDAAADGDVIELGVGTFTGPGNVDLNVSGKALTIRSQQGLASACIIDCQGSAESPARGFFFQSGETNETLIERITIANGYARGESGALNSGGAVLCISESAPTFRHCIFRDCVAPAEGGAFSAKDASPVLEDCRFVGNSAAFGGGFSVFRPCLATPTAQQTPTLYLRRCTFEDNTAITGGGLYLRGHTSYIEIVDCVVAENASDEGAGIMIHGAHVQLKDSRIVDNFSSTTGGGLSVESTIFCPPPGTGADGSPVVVSNCDISRNFAFVGGAVYLRGFELEMTGCTLVDNAATDGSALRGDSRYLSPPYFGAIANIDHSILAWGRDSQAVTTDENESEVTLACSDVFGNEGGDWIGPLEGQLGIDGNIEADPQFCDAAAPDYRLVLGSPCSPFGSGSCNLRGAYLVGCSAADVPSPPVSATSLQLEAFPNPTRSETAVRFELANEGHVSLAVFNAAGKRVATLVDGRQPAGVHLTSWSRQTASGQRAASGVYYLRATVDDRPVGQRTIVVLD